MRTATHRWLAVGCRACPAVHFVVLGAVLPDGDLPLATTGFDRLVPQQTFAAAHPRLPASLRSIALLLFILGCCESFDASRFIVEPLPGLRLCGPPLLRGLPPGHRGTCRDLGVPPHLLGPADILKPAVEWWLPPHSSAVKASFAVVGMRRTRRNTGSQRAPPDGGRGAGAAHYAGRAGQHSDAGTESRTPTAAVNASEESRDGATLADPRLGAGECPSPDSCSTYLSSPGGSVAALDSNDDASESLSDIEAEDVTSDEEGSDDYNKRYRLPDEELAETTSEDESDALPPTGTNAVASALVSCPERSRPTCSSVFHCVEDLYGYLLLRGARQLSEDQYNIVREGFNTSSPEPLPSLTRVRERLAPRVQSWMIPTTTFELPVKRKTSTVNVQCILPSSHVRRDIAFDATYRKLFEAEKRPDVERALHPDFVDSPYYNRRSDILQTGKMITRFTLDGLSISVGDRLTIVLSPPRGCTRVVATSAFFASHRSGVAQCSDVHAGDLVVTCEADGDDQMSGSLVARHWMACVLPPLSWSPESPRDTYHDVSELQMHAAEDAAGGDAAVTGDGAACSSPGRSVSWRPKKGVLGGVPFSTISLVINSDDFEARRGKNESLGGVYMSYVSMLYKDRCSSNACRTIAATPPTVDSDEVLRAITSDLAEGARTGWLCRRSDGSDLRVFADVAFFVGDYLQVCKTSRMMGYGAKSPCPLCIYRNPGVPGSRFGLGGSSADADMARTSGRTRSICKAVQNAVDDIEAGNG